MKMIVMRRPGRRRGRNLAALIGLLLTIALSACGSGQAAGDARPAVAAAFYPYYFLAERIGAGDVQVINLTATGVEPHDLELTPRQVGAVASADLVIYQKGFQPAVDEAVAQAQPEHVVDVTAFLPSDPAGPDTAARDPHAWLDPRWFATLTEPVAAALGDVDPANQREYQARAVSLAAELRALHEEFASALKACRSNVIVTNHAAFGHLAARYGLQQIAISGLAPESEPSPTRIKAVTEAVRKHRVTTVFVERLASPKAAQTLAGDLGVATAVLDPLEGLTDRAGADFFSVMRANLDSLHQALGCR
jgi:zinc transport system substrate-binding protein